MTYEILLNRYRIFAQRLAAQARTAQERQKIKRDNAECVLRNKATALQAKLRNAGPNPIERERIIHQAFKGLA